jgi:hypothetical protein
MVSIFYITVCDILIIHLVRSCNYNGNALFPQHEVTIITMGPCRMARPSRYIVTLGWPSETDEFTEWAHLPQFEFVSLWVSGNLASIRTER